VALIPPEEVGLLPRDPVTVCGADQHGIGGFRCAPGIRLRRDNRVSVRYAEELNSTKSSGILQRTDRHGILGQKPPDFQLSL
jgi:hypothetical protein